MISEIKVTFCIFVIKLFPYSIFRHNFSGVIPVEDLEMKEKAKETFVNVLEQGLTRIKENAENNELLQKFEPFAKNSYDMAEVRQIL